MSFSKLKIYFRNTSKRITQEEIIKIREQETEADLEIANVSYPSNCALTVLTGNRNSKFGSDMRGRLVV